MLGRALSVITILAIVLGGVSCGGGGGSSTTTTPTTTTTTSGSSNPIPHITDIQDGGVSGSALILRVIGTGFVTSSSVQWNGVAKPTTFVSSTTLTFTITAADVPASGTVQMNVVNPPPGGGTSNTVNIQFTTVPPVLTGISPNRALQGAAGFTLQVTGSSFFPNSVVRWNGVNLPTSYVSGTSLTAQIGADLLLQAGTAQVSVFTDGPANGATSTALPFTIGLEDATIETTLALRADALRFNPSTNRLFASVPGAAASNANSIAEIDTTGNPTVMSSVFVGSEPGTLALSGDGSTLFVALRGAAAVRKYDTASHTAGLQFSLGADSFFGPYYPDDIEVVPGSTTALAVSRKYLGVSPAFAGVAIYDDGVKRPTETPGHTGASKIEFGTAPDTIFGLGNSGGLYTLQVDANGVQNVSTSTVLTGNDFKWDNGRLYSTSGLVVDPVSKTLLGTFALPGNAPFGMAVNSVLPDAANNRVYFVGKGQQGAMIVSYNATTFLQVKTFGVPGFNGDITAAAYLGNGRFAVASDRGMIYFLNAVSASSTTVQPTLSSITPNQGTQGDVGLTVQLNGNSFVPGTVARWNGATIPTTYVSSTRLDALVSSALLGQSGSVQVTAFNPANGSTSGAVSFVINPQPSAITGTIPLLVDSLVFSGARQTLFATAPSAAGSTYGNSLVEIDTSGIPAISTSTFIGSEPGPLAISDDASTIFVGLRGSGMVSKFDVNTHALGLQFSLGSDPFFGIYRAADIAFLPGTASAIAVSRYYSGVSPSHAGVAIYDDGVKRTNETPGHTGANRIEFAASPSLLYGLNTETTEAGFRTIQIDANGATIIKVVTHVLTGIEMRSQGGLIYGSGGQAVDPVTGTIVGSYVLPTDQNLSFLIDALPDISTNRFYIVAQSFAGRVILTYDKSTFALLRSTPVTMPGSVKTVASLGNGRLAIATDTGTIYVVTVQ